MDNKFNVVYTGLQDGITVEDFTSKFCSKFGISEQKAQQIVNSNSDVIVKKDQDEKKAAKYRTAFESCGMLVRLDEIPAEPEPASGLSLEPMASDVTNADSAEKGSIETNTAAKALCPKCDSDQINGDECQACGIYISKYLENQKNVLISQDEDIDSGEDKATEQFDASHVINPYETPEAELSDPTEYDLEPEKVSAGSAVQWLLQGFWHFKQNPFAWIGAFITFFLISMIIAFIPFVGMLLINLFSPIILAGFILGCHEQHEGGDFKIGHLFAGFSSNVGQLVLVGVIYLVGFVLMGVVLGGVLGGTMMASMSDPNMNPAQLTGLIGPGMAIIMLVAVSFSALLIMSYYYAPALIALEELSAVEAMKLSLKACLKNWLAFTVYGLLILILFIVAAIPVLLGYLVAIPMLQASIYVSYRDIFCHERT